MPSIRASGGNRRWAKAVSSGPHRLRFRGWRILSGSPWDDRRHYRPENHRRRDGDLHLPARARRPSPRNLPADGRARHPRGALRHGAPALLGRLLRGSTEPLLPRRQGHEIRPRRAGEGQRRAGPHARGADQDDDPPGNAGFRRHAGLCRRAGRREARSCRHPRLLHERALFAGRRRALPGSGRGGRQFLRHMAGQRQRGEPASQSRQGQGRALYFLRRARRIGAAGDGRGIEGPVRCVRRQGRIGNPARSPPRFRLPATLVLRQTGRRAPLGAADRALPAELG